MMAVVLFVVTSCTQHIYIRGSIVGWDLLLQKIFTSPTNENIYLLVHGRRLRL